ncbi:hypothetical protein MRX96_035282 [Rhipicephalus microplus]
MSAQGGDLFVVPLQDHFLGAVLGFKGANTVPLPTAHLEHLRYLSVPSLLSLLLSSAHFFILCHQRHLVFLRTHHLLLELADLYIVHSLVLPGPGMLIFGRPHLLRLTLKIVRIQLKVCPSMVAITSWRC